MIKEMTIVPRNSVETNKSGSKFGMETELASYIKLLQTLKPTKSASIILDEHINTINLLISRLNNIIWNDLLDEEFIILRRISLVIWSTILSPYIQQLLSFNTEDIDVKAILPFLHLLTSNLECLHRTCGNDPVFLSSVALTGATLWYHLHEYQQCTSLLRKYINWINKIRASILDNLLLSKNQSTISIANIRRLQSLSFTCSPLNANSNHNNELHGSKIEEATINGIKLTLSLVDFHTDMIIYYFRSEISAGISYANSMCELSPTKSDKKKATVSTATTSTNNSIDGFHHIKNLPCIMVLKQFCKNNLYYLAILFCEMAINELDVAAQRTLLQQSKTYIEEAEAREKSLINAFNIDATSTYPVLLARTHSRSYITPVSTDIRLSSTTAQYYTILCRETYTAAPLSIQADEYIGCQQQIPHESMIEPLVETTNDISSRIVVIDELDEGESYMYACVARNTNGTPVGSVSTSTLSVDAVNPLPIALLLGNLSEVAYSLKQNSVLYNCANTLCERFYNPVKSINAPPVTVGKGINLYLLNDSSLNMEMLQSHSPLVLQYILRSFLYSENCKFKKISDAQTGMESKSVLQLRLVSCVRTTAMMGYIAVHFDGIDTTIRLVAHGINLIKQILNLDKVHMYIYVKNAISIFVSIMQTIPVKYWQEMEVDMHSQLLVFAVKCSLKTHDSASFAVLTDSLPTILGQIKTEFLPKYYSLLVFLKRYANILVSSNALAKLQAFYTVSGDTRKQINLWSMSAAQRTEALKGVGTLLLETKLSSDALIVDTELKEAPRLMSDYVYAMISIVKEFSVAPASLNIGKLLAKYPTFESYFYEPVKSIIQDYKLAFVTTSPTVKTPSHLLMFDTSEYRLQLQGLTFFTLLICKTFFSGNKRNITVNSDDGPHKGVLPGTKLSSLLPVQTETSKGFSFEGGKISIGEHGYVQLLCASITMLVQSQCLKAAVSTSVKLWNFIVDRWHSPEEFTLEYKPCLGYFRSSLDTLLLALEITAGISRNSNEAVKSTAATYELKVTVHSLRGLLLFWVKVLYLLGELEHVVTFGMRVIKLYVVISVEVAEPLSECLPLLGDAQQSLVSQARGDLAEQKKRLQTFTDAFWEARNSVRRKKLRIAQVGKDAEEEKFDADQLVYKDKVTAAEKILQTREEVLSELSSLREYFLSMYPANALRFTALKRELAELLDSHRSKYSGDEQEYERFLRTDTESKGRFRTILHDLDGILREARTISDRKLVFHVCKVKGDLLLFLQKVDAARTAFHEALDGLFNCLDTHLHWQTSLKLATQLPLDKTIQSCSIGAIALLGSLSRFCAANDWELKTNYSRMASELSRLPFLESLGHPQQASFGGFRGYVCQSLGGPNSIVYDYDSLSALTLTSGLTELVSTLAAEDLGLHALPLLVLLEHYHATYTRRVDAWLLARLQRISILTDLHFFSEAVSMIAGIKSSLLAIYDGVFGDSEELNAIEAKLATTGSSSFDTSQNGLDFFGIPPYLNNLPPQNDSNKQSIAKLALLVEELKKFLAQFTNEVPFSMGSKGANSPTNTIEKPVVKSTLKGKAGKPAEDLATVAVSATSSPIFDNIAEIRLSYIFTKLLLEMSSTSSTGQEGDTNALKQYCLDGETISDKCISDLAGMSYNNSPQIFTLTIQFRYLKGKALIVKQMYSEAYIHYRSLLEILGKQSLSSLHAVYECGQLWFKLKADMVSVLSRLGKFEYAIRFSSATIDIDASAKNCGYWRRAYLLQRCIMYSQQGLLEEADQDCKDLFAAYKIVSLEDVGLVLCFILQAYVKWTLAFGDDDSEATQGEVLSYLQRAAEMAKRIAINNGLNCAEFVVAIKGGSSDKVQAACFAYVITNADHVTDQNIAHLLYGCFGFQAIPGV